MTKITKTVKIAKIAKIAKVMGMAVASVAIWSSNVSAESLREALAAAYMGNPDLDAQRAALRAADEDLVRATAGFLPNVILQSQMTETQTDGASGSFVIDQNSTRQFYQARVDQSLFSGFQTYNGRQEARHFMNAGRAQLLSVEQQTLLNAVTAYMDVLRDQSVLELNNNQVQVLMRQLQASRDRFRVGEITRTDVAQSEARLAGARSAQITAEANLAGSRATYRQIIGDMPGTLEQPPALPPLPATLEEATMIGVEENPAIALADYNERAATSAVGREKGILLPTVGAFASIARSEGNQISFQSGSPLPVQTGTTIKTIGLQAQWSLYSGGAEYAAIRRAKQVRSQRRLQMVSADRQVRADVLSAWEVYRASRSSIQSNQSQVRANEIALEGVRQEAAVGSRTTLEVLNAEQELLDAQVNLARAARNEYVAGFSLFSAIGRLNASSLDLPVDLYDPEEYYQDVRWQFIGWGIE
jgi:outer membrane protein